jgi:site-specific recombinase XerD
MLKEHVRAFLEFLQYNRNVSPHTHTAYGSDLEQFIEYRAASLSRKPSTLTLGHFDSDAVRGFLADLHARGNSRSSCSRSRPQS